MHIALVEAMSISSINRISTRIVSSNNRATVAELKNFSKTQEDIPTLIQKSDSNRSQETIRFLSKNGIAVNKRWLIPVGGLVVLSLTIAFALPKLSIDSLKQILNPKLVTKSEVKKKEFGDPGFEGDIISLDIENIPIMDLLDFLHDKYGANFIVSQSVQDMNVRVRANDVPWGTYLESLFQANNLKYKKQGNMIVVFSDSDESVIDSENSENSENSKDTK
jgi:hypothetical protein